MSQEGKIICGVNVELCFVSYGPDGTLVWFNFNEGATFAEEIKRIKTVFNIDKEVKLWLLEGCWIHPENSTDLLHLFDNIIIAVPPETPQPSYGHWFPFKTNGVTFGEEIERFKQQFDINKEINFYLRSDQVLPTMTTDILKGHDDFTVKMLALPAAVKMEAPTREPDKFYRLIYLHPSLVGRNFL